MPELIPITMFACIAAVLILRPMTKRLGHLLEAMAREREPATASQVPGGQAADPRVLALLEQMNKRLELMEDRLDFTERLVSARRPSAQAQRSDIRLGEERSHGVLR